MSKGCRTPFGVQDKLKEKRVKEIIKDDESWNETLIKEVFLPSDADTILSMPRKKVKSRGYDHLGQRS